MIIKIIIFLILFYFFILFFNNKTLNNFNYKNKKVKDNKYNNLKINNFKYNDIYIIEDFLDKNIFNEVKNSIINLKKTKYNFNGIMRKGSATSFEEILNSKHRNIIDKVMNPNTLLNIYKTTGLNLQFIEKTDNDVLAILYYDNIGDNMDWHHDRNIFYGDRWAAILTIVNKNYNNNNYSSAKFEYKIDNKKDVIDTKENSLVLFRGDQVLHKVGSIKDNEERIVIAMVLCDLCKKKTDIFNSLYNKMVHFVYYGKI